VAEKISDRELRRLLTAPRKPAIRKRKRRSQN
jgi:hypothetical protein